MFISFVICTYNRADLLSETLEALIKQDFSGVEQYEILVVNNNSTDDTHNVLEGLSERFPSIFRHVFEPKQGISVARNRGIRAARGEVIVFTDDDVDFDKNYAVNICKFVKENRFDAIGGRILPVFPKKEPKWLKKSLHLLTGPYVIHDYGKSIKGYGPGMNPFVGANMIANKESLKKVGCFNESLGYGNLAGLGEDTQVFINMSEANMKIYYCGNICVHHKTDLKRMNLKYIGKWCESSGAYFVGSGREKTEGFKFLYGAPRYIYKKNFLLWLRAIPAFFFNKIKFVPLWMQISHNRGLIKGFRKYGKNSKK